MPLVKLKPIRPEPTNSDYTHDPGPEKSRLAPPPNTSAADAEYFEILGRATNDAIRDWNVTSGTLSWPRGLESLLGHRSAPADKIGFWFNHIHPDDLDRIEESLRETLASNAERWMGEYRFQRADREYIHILDRALIERDAQGRPTRAVCLMMDVTTRQQSQAQARRSQRMEAFGQLAGGVAHDFNNFLTTILGYSDLILSEKAVDGQLASQIIEIRDAAGRASSLTNQLLAFSRRQALEPTVLEINAFLTNLEESLLHLLGENISVTCHLHHLKEGAHVLADAGQLTQIVLNLAVNARDAMRKGGRLTIETSVVKVTSDTDPACACGDIPPGEYVALVMADNGSGMSEEVKARLFEPFFTTKGAGKRSGLGLATSYGIVRQSGGHICAESALGQGTFFRIFLPRVPAPPTSAFKKRQAARALTGTESILVLEDDVSVRHLSVRALRRLGYEVIEAARGEDAKRLMAQRGERGIDLLLTDLVMPEMSGRNFADWLGRAHPQTKVIFISGYLEESLHPGDRRDPKMCFLAKPFNVEQLASKVREVLDGAGVDG